MTKSSHFVIALVLILGLAGCGSPATPAPPSGAPSTPAGALSITGSVAKPLSLTSEALKAMPSVKIKAEHPKLGMQEYTGVRLNALLDQAQPQSGAANLKLVAGDGFTSEVALADVRKCADCLLAFSGDKLDAVMPGQASNTWVRGLVAIEVK
jgi:hypothetical protein